MLILGIESSCDDTSAAVVAAGKKIMSHIKHTQVDLHREYGGVVPEIASRAHLEVIGNLVSCAITQAGISKWDLKAVAATAGPGLIGSLLVGCTAAKGMALALKVPFIAVHHLAAHLYTPFLEQEEPESLFPFLGVILSGGHTALYLVRSWRDFELLGETRDDAVGEAFDKVSKWLGLGYPGGPIIDALAERGRRDAISFPKAMFGRETLDMSFSGIKTAVVQYMMRAGLRGEDLSQSELADIAASFQETVIEMLMEKILLATQQLKVQRVVVAGGVAANKRLRECLADAGVSLFIPSLPLCMDNGAMVAGLAYKLFQERVSFPLTYPADPNLSLAWTKSLQL